MKRATLHLPLTVPNNFKNVRELTSEQSEWFRDLGRKLDEARKDFDAIPNVPWVRP